MSYFIRFRFLLSGLMVVAAATGLSAAPSSAPAPAAPAVSAPPSSPAVFVPAPSEELVGPVQMRGETLEAVLTQLGRLTGRSIIRPQALPATEGYTITLPQMVKSEAIVALETMLELSGISINPLGDKFLKVVPLAQARTEAPQMITGSTRDFAPSGRVASKLFQLEFLRVTELNTQLAPLLNQNLGGPVVFEKTNAVLITDSISNLQRVEQLIRQLDRPVAPTLQPKFYALHFAKASDLVTKIGGILKPPLSSLMSSSTSVSADDRTNQIVVITDPRQYAFFDELIGKLDVKSDPNTRNEVIYLKHATAKDVATLLTNLVSGRSQAASKSGQQGAAQNTARPNAPAAGGNPGAATAPAVQVAVASLVNEAINDFSSLVTVLSDDRSNSVVVSGTVDDIRLIREIVEKVDVLLAQVSIQVVIAEVTLSDTDTTGLSALDLTFATSSTRGTHISNFSGSVGGWTVSSGVLDSLSFEAVMGNVGSKSNVKVLSANTIVTTHNKQAEFVVSQQQPIITGSTSTTNSSSSTGYSTSSTVTYKDIGISVKVTPLIGDDGSIQLEIDQKVDDKVGSVTIDSNTQPIIGHREATSFINVKDGQIIVLSGLQQTKHSTSRDKLGFLYEIPLISHLLGGRTHEEDRTELLLFVRPHIINPDSTTSDANKSINELTNKDQVQQYLKDPAANKKENLLKQLTQ